MMVVPCRQSRPTFSASCKSWVEDSGRCVHRQRNNSDCAHDHFRGLNRAVVELF
jgi:hypothetical protein